MNSPYRLTAVLPHDLTRFDSLFVSPAVTSHTGIDCESNPNIEPASVSIDDFFGAENEESPTVAPTLKMAPVVELAPLRDFLLDELADEIRRFYGVDSLKHLFWSLLGYERVNESLPDNFFRASTLESLLSARLFAQHDGLRIILIQAKEGRFHETVRRAILNHVAAAWGQAVVLFCDYEWKKVALGFQSGGNKHDGAFIRLVPLPRTADHQARRIARLRTHTSEDVRRPLLDLSESYHRLVAERIEAKEDREVFAEESVDPDTLYFREQSRHDVLPEEETQKLLERIALISKVERKTTRRDEYEGVRDRLLIGHWRLCGFVIKHHRLRKRCLSLSTNDLIQEGLFGLMEAIDHFDSQHNTKFSTYACFWIRQSIQRGIYSKDRIIRLPAYCYSEKSFLPTHEARRLRWILSLSRHEFGISHSVADATGDDTLQKRETESSRPFLIDQVMRHLSLRERAVLESRFGLRGMSESTLEELGDRFGITRERIRQIEGRALEKLRNGPHRKQLSTLL